MWANSLTYLPICCGAGEPTDESIVYGTYFHHVGRTVSASSGEVLSHDYITHRLWLQSVGAKGAAARVDLKHFADYEYKQGVAAFVAPFSNKGFENSLLLHQHRQKPAGWNGTFHRSSYGPAHCADDVRAFTAWAPSLSESHPARSYLSATGDLLTLQNDDLNPREPRICAEYGKFLRLKGKESG